MYEYDPVDTLGDVLPYHIKLLDDRLRKSKWYETKHTFSGGACIFWSIFFASCILIALLVLSIIWLAGVIGVWTIPAAFGLAFVFFMIGFGFGGFLIKSRDKKIDKMLSSRTNEFNAILNQFMAEEPLFRELNHISISVGQFGSFLELKYWNEYIDRTTGRKPHRINDYSDDAFVANSLDDQKPAQGTNLDYPVAQPF